MFCRVPPNVEFLIDDAEEPWAFPEKFDFVHARQMVGSFASWPKFVETAYEYVIPLFLKIFFLVTKLAGESVPVGGSSFKTLAYLQVTTKISPRRGLISGTVRLLRHLMPSGEVFRRQSIMRRC